MNIILAVCFLFQDKPADPLAEGKQLVQAKEFAKAHAFFKGYVAQNPNDRVAWFFAGYTLAAQKKFEEAVSAYQKAIDLGLKQYKSYHQLGYCAYRAGKYDAGEKALTQALTYEPENPDALHHLALCQYELKKFAPAEQGLSKVLVKPSVWTEMSAFYRGLTRVQLKRPAEAAGDFAWVAGNGRDKDLREKAAAFVKKFQEEGAVPPRPVITAPPPPPTPKIWNLVVYEKATYDSNVVRLPEDIPNRGNEEDEQTVTSLLMGSVDPFRNKILTARLTGLDLEYAENSEFSLIAGLAALENETRLFNGVTGQFSLHEETFTLDRKAFFRKGGGKYGLKYDFSPVLSLSGQGVAMSKDFLRDAYKDLDGVERELNLQIQYKEILSWLGATLKYQYHEEDADKGDRSYESHEFRLKFDIKLLPPRLTAQLEPWIKRQDYDQKDRTYLEVRGDKRWSNRVGLYYLWDANMQVFIDAEVEYNDSNITEFDYDRYAIGTGFVLFY